MAKIGRIRPIFAIQKADSCGIFNVLKYFVVCNVSYAIGFIKSKFQYIWHVFFLHLPKPTVARFSVSKTEGWGFLKTDGRLSADVSTDFGWGFGRPTISMSK